MDAFCALPVEHRATIVVALKMYASVMNTGFGSVTFSRADIERLPLFDEIGPTTKLSVEKVHAVIAHLIPAVMWELEYPELAEHVKGGRK